ncbi:tripartite tricarboxylate transporter TctB family protein [Aquamicrobium terrae]
MKLKRDMVAGLVFSTIGLGALAIALGYPFGSTLNMGPGYFPTLVSGLIVVLGIALTIRELRAGNGALLTDIAWRPLAIIIAAVAGFAILIQHGGLIPAVCFLTAVGWYADPRRSLRALPVQLVIGILVPILIFRIGLNMPIPLWRF